MADQRIVLATETLRQKIGAASVAMYDGGAGHTFTFADAAPNLAAQIVGFYDTFKRAPTLIFNDGIPPSWKTSLERDPATINALLGLVTFTDNREYSEGEEWVSRSETHGVYIFNSKLWAKDGAQFRYTRSVETGEASREEQIVDLSLIGAYNSRVINADVSIPRDKFSGGAFQTWGVLMLAKHFPETIYPSDDGFMLHIEGVAILERTCAYWWNRLYEFPEDYNQWLLSRSVGTGPILPGIPEALAANFRRMIKDLKSNGGIRYLATVVMGIVGFAFGAAALGGLAGGAFTIPNFSGALNMVSRFGVDTGNLGPALKLVGALTGNVNLADTVSTGASASEDAIVKLGDAWGLDNLGDSFAVDAWSADSWASPDIDVAFASNFGGSLPSDVWGFGEVGDGWSPEVLSDTWGFVEQYEFDLPPVESWETAQDAFRRSEIQEQNAGPVSATQYSIANQAPQAVAAATNAALKTAGGNPASTSQSPATVQRAQTIAQQQAANARTPQETSIWQNAMQLLSGYANYQLESQRIEARMPQSLQYPSSQQTMVRQPDGSITMRRPDGTLVTVRPDGSTVQTGAGGTLPAFLAQNKTLLLAGAGVGLLALVFVLSSSRK